MNCIASKILLITFTITTSLLAQSESKLFNITPYAGIQYFYWGEYHNTSIQDLEEYGAVLLGGINSNSHFSNKIGLYALADVRFYYGVINYNGYLQLSSGGTEPYKSETAYLGLEVQLNLGYDFTLGNHFVLSPEFGFQYEYWDRDIDNGGRYGYNELWRVFFIDFGCNFIVPFSSSSKIFLKVLGEYPISISESVDLASRGQGGSANINLEPGANIGINTELGIQLSGIFFSIHLDYLLFSSSLFDQGFHQPRSDRSLTGLKLGYTF